MSRADERRRQQEADRLDDEQAMNARPNEPPTVLPPSDRCLMGPHDYTMKGNDGIYRCWHCCRRKPGSPTGPPLPRMPR